MCPGLYVSLSPALYHVPPATQSRATLWKSIVEISHYQGMGEQMEKILASGTQESRSPCQLSRGYNLFQLNREKSHGGSEWSDHSLQLTGEDAGPFVWNVWNFSPILIYLPSPTSILSLNPQTHQRVRSCWECRGFYASAAFRVMFLFCRSGRSLLLHSSSNVSVSSLLTPFSGFPYYIYFFHYNTYFSLFYI